jgi:hypothetical protein
MDISDETYRKTKNSRVLESFPLAPGHENPSRITISPIKSSPWEDIRGGIFPKSILGNAMIEKDQSGLSIINIDFINR